MGSSLTTLAEEATALTAATVANNLVDLFIHKLRERNVTVEKLAQAEKLIKAVRFDEFNEVRAARLITFRRSDAKHFISHLASAYRFDQLTADSLVASAQRALADQSGTTCLQFEKGKQGEFRIFYAAMHRQGENIHLGIAQNVIKFRLSPKMQSTYQERGLWFFRYEVKTGEALLEQDLSPDEKEQLENFFIVSALKKFLEDIPYDSDKLPDETAELLQVTSVSCGCRSLSK